MTAAAMRASADGATLTVSGLIVPWDVEVTVDGRPEVWRRGALDAQMATPAGRAGVTLDVGHLSEPGAGPVPAVAPVGRLTDTRADPAGQWASFRLEDSDAARTAWALARAGTLDSFSVFFVPLGSGRDEAAGRARRIDHRGRGEITDAVLLSVALTDRPVYTVTAVTAVTAAARALHPALRGPAAAPDPRRAQILARRARR